MFEEVTVKTVGETVSGPAGPVTGAVITSELHMDGSREDKTFAPGYGELSTGSGSNLEAIALAVPTDALAGTVPAEGEAMQSGAMSIFDAAAASNWTRATLDFRRRYRPPTEVGQARFDLWAAQILVDAAANSSSGVRGDVATMEYVRHRFAELAAP